MPRSRITKRLVDAMRPGDLLWDSDVAGFGIRCQRDRKIYLLKTQINRRSRWFSIGPHGGPWTPETARAEAQRLLGDIRSGVNLVAIREGRRAAPTMADLAERYLEEHAVPHKKPKSVAGDRQSLRNHILPALGTLNVADITREDVEHFKRAVREGKSVAGRPKKPRKGRLGPDARGGPTIANRSLALLSKMFNLAEVWGWRPDNSNPCRHVARFAERRSERFLADEEIARLLGAIEAAEAGNGASIHALAAIRLLLLTGARRGEILDLQWSHVDLQRAMLMLPDSKTGAKVIHLNDDAITLLRSLPRLEGNPFVIAGHATTGARVDINKTWRQIRNSASLPGLRLHDLRHSFASIAAANGASLPMIGKLLGHSSPLTTQRYAHLVADQMKELAQRVGQSIGKAKRAMPTES